MYTSDFKNERILLIELDVLLEASLETRVVCAWKE